MAIPAAIRSFLEHLHLAAYICDRRGRMLYLNPEATRLTGWRLTEVEGRSCEKVLGRAAVDGAAGGRAFVCTMQTRAGKSGTLRAVASALDLGNETGSVVLITSPWQDPDPSAAPGRGAGADALAAAVAGQRWAEAALAAQDEFVNSVFDTIQEGISILDADLTIRRVNRIMRQWYAGREPMEGRRCYVCYHDRIGPCNPCPTLRCMQTGQVEREIVAGPKGSPVQWIELFSFPVKTPGSGKVHQVVEFVRDITARVHVEAQIQRLQQLEAFAALAETIGRQIETAVKELGAGREPLVLAESAPAAGRSGPEPLAGRMAEVMHRLSQLQAYAAGERFGVRPVAPAALVAQILAQITPLLAGKIRIETDLADDLPQVAVDPDQMQLALSHLIRNGAEALVGGGLLRLIGRRFNGRPPVQGAAEGTYLCLCVADEGCGMTPDAGRRIFDPLFTTKGYGRGRGGAVVAAIVAAHEGWIAVDSTCAEGTRVTIYLPAAHAAAGSVVVRAPA